MMAAVAAGGGVMTATPASASLNDDQSYLDTSTQPAQSVDSADPEYAELVLSATPACTTEYSPVHQQFPDHVKLRLRSFIKYYICTSQDGSTTWSRPFAVVGAWNTTDDKTADCEFDGTGFPWSEIRWFTEFTASNGFHFEFEFSMDCKTAKKKELRDAQIPKADRRNLYWGPNGVEDLPHWFQTDTVARILAPDDVVLMGGPLGYFP